VAFQDTGESEFYATHAAHERWSVRTLRERITSQLYVRTITGDESADQIMTVDPESQAPDSAGPNILFRDPYVLDFLGLPGKHTESQLETAILDEIQRFLLELGVGFAFVERQKRMTVDGRDFRLDLLLYHITERCYVAVELKTRPLDPGDYGQMLLYLRSRQLRVMLREPPAHHVAEHLHLGNELADVGISGDAYSVIVDRVASRTARVEIVRRLGHLGTEHEREGQNRRSMMAGSMSAVSLGTQHERGELQSGVVRRGEAPVCGDPLGTSIGQVPLDHVEQALDLRCTRRQHSQLAASQQSLQARHHHPPAIAWVRREGRIRSVLQLRPAPATPSRSGR